MSTLDVVAEVLREVAPRALKAREITALAGIVAGQAKEDAA